MTKSSLSSRALGGGDAGSLLPGVLPPELAARRHAPGLTRRILSYLYHTHHATHTTHHTHHTTMQHATHAHRTHTHHPWGPGTPGSWALRNPHPESRCVGEERRAGLGQALPSGSPNRGVQGAEDTAVNMHSSWAPRRLPRLPMMRAT